MASTTDQPQSSPDGGLEQRHGDRPDNPLAYVAWWWRTRHRGTTAEDRRRVIDSMFSTGGGIRTGRFWAMQAMAIVIATMGLSANSAAVVIGAMLVAPLMTPIMAVATALALGWPHRAIMPLVGTLVASGASIGLAWLLHSLIATATVTEEILARTSPDLRDLMVALAAGAAGALGTARQDVSAALPGVAVAVALVPPLAAVGACLELGRTDLASGALLLFVTNLVAIVMASIVVLLWCGFVPARLIQRGRVAVWGGSAATLLLLVAVGVPLTLRTVDAAESAEANRSVTEAVLSWLTDQPDTELADLAVRGNVVRIDVTGPDEPLDVAGISRQIDGLLGEGASTTVRWSVRSTADPNGGQPEPEPPPDPRADDLVVVRSVVDSWAADESGIDVVGVSVGDTTVVVDVVGERAPTTVRALADALRSVLGREVEAEVRFSQRLVIDGDPTVDRRATIAAALARVLDASDVQVDAVRFRETDDGLVERVVVDLGGSTPPSDPAALVDIVLDTVEDLEGFAEEVEVQIRFTERRLLPLVDEPSGDDDPSATDDAVEETLAEEPPA